jgi:hypothetical protein
MAEGRSPSATVLLLRQCLACGRNLIFAAFGWRFIRIQESMQRVPVNSSSIASIGYAPEQRVLELEFRQSGEVCQYFDVPAEEHTAFLAADSKGTYLNLHFKPRQYRYHRFWPQQE